MSKRRPMTTAAAAAFVQHGPAAARQPAQPVAATGTVMLSVRLRPDVMAAVRMAAVTRKNAGQQPATTQGVVQVALEEWLRSHGHL
jgi:hypothetical protein